MIRDILDWFQGHLEEEVAAGDGHDLHLAVAALLMEVSRADHDKDSSERQAILDILDRKFTFTPEELTQLVQLGEDETDTSHDLYQFTRVINDHYDYDGKVALVRTLWEVAYADGLLEAIEDHIIRRIAGLLHVDHQEFVRTRIEVRDSLKNP